MLENQPECMWLVWLEASVKQLFKNWILSCKLRASNWTCLEKSLKLSSHALHRFSSGLAMFSMSKLHKICRIRSRESTMELKGRCQNEPVKSWSTALSLVASNRFSSWSESEWCNFWSSCMKWEDSFWTEWCHNDVIMMFDRQLSRSTWFILIWDIGRTKKTLYGAMLRATRLRPLARTALSARCCGDVAVNEAVAGDGDPIPTAEAMAAMDPVGVSPRAELLIAHPPQRNPGWWWWDPIVTVW